MSVHRHPHESCRIAFQQPEEAPTPFCLRATTRGEIIGSHRKLRDVLATVDRVARSSCTVLVIGEGGSGKELVVAALHDASVRRRAALVTIHCSALPESLLEKELFGDERGAGQTGYVAAAEGGTLVIDEVSELPLSAQGKLIHLLHRREYTPVGACAPLACDVRVVATTQRDLAAEVRAGRFREDLYERLNAIPIAVPALRNRRTDLPLLADHFFRSFARRYERDDLKGISEDTLLAIQACAWPGNVRALENAIQHAVLLARGPMLEPHDVLDRSDTVSAATPRETPSGAITVRPTVSTRR